MKTVSIVVPVYNEIDNIPVLYSRLQDVAGKRPDLDFRLIFVNDGSTDGSAEALDQLAETHGNVVVLHQERGNVILSRERVTRAKGNLRATRFQGERQVGCLARDVEAS